MESSSSTQNENKDSIILVDSMGGAAAVNISENLPTLTDEIWSEDDSMEEFYTPGLPPDEVDKEGQSSSKVDDKRWGILMNKLTNIENNTRSLSEDLNALEGKVGCNTEQIAATKTTVAKNERRLAELHKRYESALAEMDRRMTEKFSAMEGAMQENNETFKAEVISAAEEKAAEKAKEHKQELQDEIIQGQYNSRKINLMIMGIPESEKDDTKELVISFFSKRMSIKQAGVDIAYRLGKADSRKPRPVLVKFKEMAHRNRVWFSKSKIIREDGDSKAWIQEDLPKAVKNSYRTFYRILKKAKSLGDRFPDAHIKGQSLVIDGKTYGEGDLENLPEVLRPSNLAMMQSDNALIFFGRFSPLSNHHQATFTVNATKFSCMEQYIAWSRATHAGRANLVAKALKPADPIIYKGILNELKANKSNDITKAQIAQQWYEQLDGVVNQGLRAKFQQNPTLARFLCSTFPKALGEACPDTRWGIGFTLTDPDALNTNKWPADGNVMGKQLSLIRDELIANKNA